MGIFRGIGSAKSFKNGRYFDPGNYRVKVERCKYGRTRPPKNRDFFAVECEILESDCPTRKVGEKATYMIMLDTDGGLGNTADFMRVGLAAYACGNGEMTTPEEISGDELEGVDEHGNELPEGGLADRIVGEENMLVDVELDLYAWHKKTQAGGDFTVHEFTIPEDVMEKAAA